MPRLPDIAIDLGPTSKTFRTGLLLDLLAAIRRSRPGDLIALTTEDPTLASDLDAWSRLTGHTIVESAAAGGGTRWVIRHGAIAESDADTRPLGTRLWLYTNFDCNLRCDYCCVRSSPRAPRRELGLARVQRIADEASRLGVAEIFLTGGEPFILADIGDIVLACAPVAPTTVLTNGMLFEGRRLGTLRSLPRDRVTLQISLDSPTPEIHDAHRGAGSWPRAWQGIRIARAEGFRVRLAATVDTEDEAEALRAFLDREGVAERDRVIRRIARRGFAERGLVMMRADLVPEITITADGVYWHPVGAEDEDLLVTREIFPLAEAFEAARRLADRERGMDRRLARIFHCA
jgi:pyruvate-formate lyase-activating enzyme/TusA-related sulfurtransferase